jgi:nitrogen regulatory protein P-II 2
MKLIKAVIRPIILDKIREALQEINVSGLTVTEVKGYGRQKGHLSLYKGADYRLEFIAKVLLEIAVEDQFVQKVIELITDIGRSGLIGDGKVFITPLDSTIRIRTSEFGSRAV